MLKYTIFIFLITSCRSQEARELSVPWYISERIQTGDIENYNFADSLSKYKVYGDFKLSNRAKYISYITDLEFKINKKPKTELIKQIDFSYNNDKQKFCDNLISPALKYIKPINRPDRRYSKPYIIDLDMDYFIKKCIDCNLLSDSTDTNQEIGNLKLYNIKLKDQWYRNPQRKANPILQAQYDDENREELDKLHDAKLVKLERKEIRSSIYILLLHSTDCNWTRKWLKIYFEHCNNYSRYIDNLKHFLWRSSCKDETTIDMVKSEIEKQQA